MNEDCNVINYFERYGGYLNRLLSFCHPQIYYKKCLLLKKHQISIETRCGTTAMIINYLLTGSNMEIYNYKIDHIKDQYEELLDIWMEELEQKKIINVDVYNLNQFPGHIFVVVKENNMYAILQSYLYEYDVLVCRGSREDVYEYIKNFMEIFIRSNKWNKQDILIWKQLTNVKTPNLINKVKPQEIHFSSPLNPITKCMDVINNTLEESINILNNIMQVIEKYNIGDKKYDEIKKIRTAKKITLNDMRNIKRLKVFKDINNNNIEQLINNIKDDINVMKKNINRKYLHPYNCFINKKGNMKKEKNTNAYNKIYLNTIN